jgi:drug/metabolite transporter (DMT)-like permease
LLWGHGVGLLLLLAWIPLDPGVPIVADMLAGSIASVFGLSGLVLLYTGLARGRAAVVAPAAAVVGAVVPVVAGVGQGSAPGLLGWGGVLLALPAIYLVSTVDGQPRRAAGLAHGVGAGVFFGGYFVALAQATEGSGMWPLVASRMVSLVLLALVGLVATRSWLRPPGGRVGLAVLGVGVLDLVGNIGYLLAANLASLVVVAVVASLYPAVTVLMARIVHLERLSPRQISGLSLGVAAVALLSVI